MNPFSTFRLDLEELLRNNKTQKINDILIHGENMQGSLQNPREAVLQLIKVLEIIDFTHIQDLRAQLITFITELIDTVRELIEHYNNGGESTMFTFSDPLIWGNRLANAGSEINKMMIQNPEIQRQLSVINIQRMGRGRKISEKEKLIQQYKDVLCYTINLHKVMSEDTEPGYTIPVPKSLKKKYGNEITLECNPGSERGPPWTIGQLLTPDKIMELYLLIDPPLGEPRHIFNQAGGYVVKPIFY